MQIAERIISALEVFNKENPTTALLISFDAEDVRAQAAASTQRFEEGNAHFWRFRNVFVGNDALVYFSSVFSLTY